MTLVLYNAEWNELAVRSLPLFPSDDDCLNLDRWLWLGWEVIGTL